MIFRPDLGSIPLLMWAPFSASPRKPCSGANTPVMVIPNDFRVSIRWVLPMVEVGLATIPISRKIQTLLIELLTCYLRIRWLTLY